MNIPYSSQRSTVIDEARIKLEDPDRPGRKIKLSVRTMSLSREIQGLPSDLRQLHLRLLGLRGDQNKSLYDTVATWVKLRTSEGYWEHFGYKSEAAYLAAFGLPDGEVLASLMVMVNLFERSTFIILGRDVLDYMIYSVGMRQKDTDKRKDDYRGIFAWYCAGRDYFDKQEFYQAIKDYLEKTYEARPVSRVPLVERRATAQHSRTYNSRERVAAPSKQRVAPLVEEDFQWSLATCAGCKEYELLIEDYRVYALSLEKVIKAELGEGFLPKKPQRLRFTNRKVA